MNVRQINLALRITASLLAGGALLSLIGGLAIPLETSDQPASADAVTVAKDSTSQLPSVDSFAPIFDRPLQGTPSSPGDVAVKVDQAPADTGVPVAQLTLVGTIGNSVALIKGPDGTVGMVELGDDVNGAVVTAIRPSQVELRMNGRITTLVKAPAPDAGSIFVKQ